MKEKKIQELTNTIPNFEELKIESEKFWRSKELEDNVYGFQIQTGSKWKEGLKDEELKIFQDKLGIEFPDSLKTFYRTMNGLDRPGINVLAEKDDAEYGTIFYSYPDDIDEMKEYIHWVKEENNSVKYNQGEVPPIVPYYGHRFLIIGKYEQVLSMYGNDIILWAENLIQGIAQDIFEINFDKMKDIELKPIEFWGDKVQ